MAVSDLSIGTCLYVMTLWYQAKNPLPLQAEILARNYQTCLMLSSTFFGPKNIASRDGCVPLMKTTPFLKLWIPVCLKNQEKGVLAKGLSKRCFWQTVNVPGWHPPFSSFSPISGVWGAKSFDFVGGIHFQNFRPFLSKPSVFGAATRYEIHKTPERPLAKTPLRA